MPGDGKNLLAAAFVIHLHLVRASHVFRHRDQARILCYLDVVADAGKNFYALIFDECSMCGQENRRLAVV